MNNLKEDIIDDKHLCQIYGPHACEGLEHSDMYINKKISTKKNLHYLVHDESSLDSPCEYSDVVNWGNISLNNETPPSGEKINNTLPWRRWVSNKIKRKPKNNNNTYLDKAPVTRKVWQE